MAASRFLGIFRPIIALYIVVLFVSCGGGGGGGGGDSALSLTLNSPSGNVTINKGETVTFQVTVSGGTAPYTYEWNFDGGATNSNVEDPGSIIFSDSGTYNVTLTVTDDGGSTKTTSITITVEDNSNPQALSATIISPASNITITQGESVNFQATVTGGLSPYTYLWNFNGGASNNTAEDLGSVTFNTVGIYNVTFTVTDNKSDSSSDSVTVTVNSPGEGDGGGNENNTGYILDATFGISGIAKTPVVYQISAYDNGYYQMCLQPDGKILVVGPYQNVYSSSSLQYIGVIRYNTDGSLDTTFGTEGIAETSLLSDFGYSSDILTQSDGKILVAGHGRVVRLNTDGSLDTTFGTNGESILEDTSYIYDMYCYNGVVPASNGIFEALGTSIIGNPIWIGLNRSGVAYSDIEVPILDDPSVTGSYASNICGYPGNNRLISGIIYKEDNIYETFIVRYLDSSIDTTFGTNGFVKTSIGRPIGMSIQTEYSFDGTSLQENHRIVFSTQLNYLEGIKLSRYNTNGSIDSTFGSGGVVATSIKVIPQYRPIKSRLLIQNDGKILVVGGPLKNNSTMDTFKVARYNTDGSLDTGFGDNGTITTPVGSSESYATDIAVLLNGDIILVGTTKIESTRYVAVARYKLNN